MAPLLFVPYGTFCSFFVAPAPQDIYAGKKRTATSELRVGNMAQPLDKNIYESSDLHGKHVAVAYSGGLDTSFCAAYFTKICGAKVHAISVDTGGFSEQKKKEIAAKAAIYGAVSHQWADAKQKLFDHFLKYLLFGNCLRGGTYPLAAGAERYVIAEETASAAKKLSASAIIHGSTGAGNDQVRFDVAFGVLSPHTPILVPVRDFGCSRQDELAFLSSQGLPSDFAKGEYSINEGMWGTTIGGKETKGTYGLPPDSAYLKTVSISKAPDTPAEVQIGFEAGIPVSLNGEKMQPVQLIMALEKLAGSHGVGRGTHLGDTILGIKGRIAFEAPAAIVLIAAHHELEKAVLTKLQAKVKSEAAEHYATLLHEGQAFDPVMHDIEQLLDSSQQHVTGKVGVKLHKGNCIISGCESPFSMLDLASAVYGEQNTLWTGAEAAGFGKIAGMQSRLAAAASKNGVQQGAKKKHKSWWEDG